MTHTVQYAFAGFPNLIVDSFPDAFVMPVAPHWCDDCGTFTTPETHSEKFWCADSEDEDGNLFHGCVWIMFPCHQSRCDSCHELTDNINGPYLCGTCECCEDCCECLHCGFCGEVTDESEFCSNCYCCESHCDCVKCGYCGIFLSEDEYLCCDCGHCEANCCQCSHSDHSFFEDWRDSDPAHIENVSEWTQIVDPVTSMADFYIADYVLAVIGNVQRLSSYNGTARTLRLAIDAKRLQDSVIALCDPAFRAYGIGACSGEARHHSTARNYVPQNRSSAFTWGAGMAEDRGTVQFLSELVSVFEDGTWSAGYGGTAWSTCARTVLMREDGTLDAKTFVDRCFSLQHNGGSFLNKRAWRGNESLTAMQYIGNAHAAEQTDFETLVCYASADGIALLRTLVTHNAWTFGNRSDIARIEDALRRASEMRRYGNKRTPFVVGASDGMIYCDCGTSSCALCSQDRRAVPLFPVYRGADRFVSEWCEARGIPAAVSLCEHCGTDASLCPEGSHLIPVAQGHTGANQGHENLCPCCDGPDHSESDVSELLTFAESHYEDSEPF